MASSAVTRLLTGVQDDEADKMLENDISASEDEEEDDSEEKHKNLLQAIGSLDDGSKQRKGKISQRSEPHPSASEFHFSSTGDDSGKVQLHELIGSLNNTATHGAIKKKLESMEKKVAVLDVPLPKPQAERIQRAVAYEEVSKDLNKWASTVKKNREAEHISFPLEPYRPPGVSTRSLTANFKPMTPLELEVAAVLRGSSQVLDRPKHELTLEEEEALKAMDLDEAQERLKELQRLRALQSYYEQKCRRMKKIKSKKYHKVKRKAEEKAISKLSLEELEEKDPEKFHQEMEKMEKARIMERMSLKHRNTSKWAKQLMIKGAKDKEARKVLSEQLQLSRRLTEKATVSDSDEEREDAEEENDDASPVSVLVSHSDNPWMVDGGQDNAKVVQQPSEPSGKVRRLQPITAKDTHEDTDISRESDKDEEEKNGDEEFELVKIERKEDKTRKRESTHDCEIGKNSFEEKDEKACDGKKRKRKKKRGEKMKEKRESFDEEQEKEEKKEDIEVMKNTEEDVQDEKLSGVCGDLDHVNVLMIEGNSDGLELNQNEIADDKVKQNQHRKKEKVSKKKKKSKEFKEDENVRVDPQKIFAIEDHGRKYNLQNTNADSDEEETQRINIRQAFANDDVVEEFIQEKNDVIEAAKPKAVDMTLPGWGDWGGSGLTVSARKRKKFTIPAGPAPVRKDRKLAHVIINEGIDKRFAKSQVKELPYPFTSFAQYERSIRTPIGKHWNSETVTNKMIKPKISTLPGTIIDPIKPTKAVKNWKSEKQRGKTSTENSAITIHN